MTTMTEGEISDEIEMAMGDDGEVVVEEVGSGRTGEIDELAESPPFGL